MPSAPRLFPVPAALLLLAACQSDKPEAKVRAAFDRAKAAIEASDAAGALEVLAKDFKGPEGLDRATARFVLMGIFRQGAVGITVLRNEVAPEGAGFHQQVDLLLTQKGGGLLPSDAGRRTYLLRWKLEGGEWRIGSLEEVR